MTQIQIYSGILKRYAELKATPGHKLDYEWVKNHFKRKCKDSEFGLIRAAIDDLIHDNMIQINYDDDHSALMLTRVGFEIIYKVDAEKTIKKMAMEIMSLFGKQKSLPNHVLMLTWLEQMLPQNFNPGELELLPEAIESLSSRSYIKKEHKNDFCIILTQSGYDAIQQPLHLKKAS